MEVGGRFDDNGMGSGNVSPSANGRSLDDGQWTSFRITESYSPARKLPVPIHMPEMIPPP